MRRGTGCTVQRHGLPRVGVLPPPRAIIINRELREMISAGATQANDRRRRRNQGHDEPASEAALQLVRVGEKPPRGAAEDHA